MGRRTLTSSHPVYEVLRALLVVLLIITTTYVFILLLIDQLEETRRSDFLSQAERLASQIGDLPQDEARSMIASAATLLELDVEQVRNGAGESPSGLMRSAEIGRPQVRTSADGGSLLTLVRIAERDDFLRVSKPLPVDSGGYRSMLTGFGWTIGVLACLCLLLSFWRSSRNRRDVRSIVQGASRFASGDLAFRIPQTGEKEWDRLSISLNRMARQLSDQLRSLQAQRLQQRAILESMGSAVIALDRDHRLLSAHRAAEHLFDIDVSCRGRLLQEVLREPSLHRIVDIVLNSGERKTSEFESVVVQGRRLSAIAEQMRDADEQQIGAVVLVDDVTDIRRLESMRSDFAANVSHELRTPITNIQGYVETLQDIDLENTKQSSRFLGIIQRNAERLSIIIEDLLMLARLEQPEGLSEDDLHPAELQKILEEVLERQRPSAQIRSIELEIESQPSLEVLTRGDLLVEAISNLVSNAIRYGPENRPVKIRAEEQPEDGMVRITVTDHGSGIPEQHIPRLFERFYRVDKARSRAEGGTGLGLAIVKHIALVHGGSVQVDSPPGEGATFILNIPTSNRTLRNRPFT